MKKITKKVIPIAVLSILLSSCSLVENLEHHVTVNFEYNGEVIKTGTVHEFKNCLVPSLSDAQIPTNHEFFGWTWLNPDSLSYTDESFESSYVEADGIVRYDDISDYVVDGEITLKPVFIHEDDIPIPDYYIAIGWYAKTSTSGLTQSMMDAWTEDLKEYLASEGATEEDLANIVVNAYDGDVATAGALINKDRYIDVLVGFGNNINTTGGVEIIEKVGGISMGGKTRYIARLTEKDTAVLVYSWLQTDEGVAALQ